MIEKCIPFHIGLCSAFQACTCYDLDRESRLKENQNGKRMCVLALRETNPDGPNRIFTRAIRDENGKDTRHAVRERIVKDSTWTADEHHSYDDLVGQLPSARRPQSVLSGRGRHQHQLGGGLLQPQSF
jgi:hypothetical protein